MENAKPGGTKKTAFEHAGAMNAYMTMMRTGLFLQREGPGSEPGNSLWRPDGFPQCSVGTRQP